MSLRYLLAALVPVLLLAAAFAASAQAPKPAAKPKPAEALSRANNQFGFDLLEKLHVEGENTFISPTSIAMCLQLAAAGAGGETLTDMQRVMHTSKLDASAENAKLLQAVREHKDFKLHIANSVWTDPANIRLNTEFASEAAKNFEAEILARNFKDPATLNEVNAWVAKRTDNKIPKALTELSPDTVALLVNAVYFKAGWKRTFNKEKTKDADFAHADGTTRSVRMMSRKDYYHFAGNADVQMVQLPYGENEGASMWVLLPAKDKTIADVLAKLREGAFEKWRPKFISEGTVELPRFKMKFRTELSDTLKALGMESAFGAEADFARFKESDGNPFFISKVIHEAVLEVDEEGTTAAAVTVIMGDMGPPPKQWTFTCDRPFIVMIMDDTTGSVLFTGTVYKPEPLE
jgi:serpin B